MQISASGNIHLDDAKGIIFRPGTSTTPFISSSDDPGYADLTINAGDDIQIIADDVHFRDNSTRNVVMTIAGHEENVGIGVSSPTEKLELETGGKIKLDSNNSDSGSIIFLGHDSDALFSTENDSAAGHPRQFVLKHQLGNTELINRRGDLILSASSQYVGINTEPTRHLHISSSGVARVQIDGQGGNNASES